MGGAVEGLPGGGVLPLEAEECLGMEWDVVKPRAELI